MIPDDRLEQIVQRFEFLEAKMNEGASGDQIASLGREYSELRPVVEQIAAYRQLSEDLAEAQEMLADPDMRALAEEELPLLKARFPDAERALQLTLLPKDAADARAAMIEIRPGTVAMRPRFLPVTCCVCINVTLRRTDGALILSKKIRQNWAGLKRWWPMLRVRGCLPD